MKNLIPVIGVVCLLGAAKAKAQKTVSELTLVYDYSVVPQDGTLKPDASVKATHTVYIKGNKSRSEITDAQFSSTTFYDATTGLAVILKEVSGQKLLIHLNPANWQDRGRQYEGIVFQNTNETREIAGYKCIKAMGTTKSGSAITVYYTRDLVPQNRDYEPLFKSLEGLPLEYELTNGNLKIRYMISRINLNPVPASKFDIPKSGYREMNYDESKKI